MIETPAHTEEASPAPAADVHVAEEHIEGAHDLAVSADKANSVDKADGVESIDSVDSAEKQNDERTELDLGYNISLDSFSGPLDLLLYLVRRSEVDIIDIPISEIADQFVATLQIWEDMDLDVAGDFIFMAASLLELKARMIVPPEVEETDDGEEEAIDPRSELISQLLAYRQFKEASLILQELEERNTLCHFRRVSERIPDAPEEIDDFDLENADPYQLFSVWDAMMSIIEGKVDRVVVYDDIPLEQRSKFVIATMKQASEAELSWLFMSVETRIQRVGIFVAVLDSVRKQFIEAIQHEQYGSVYLRYRADDERIAKPMIPEIEEEPTKKRRRRKRQLVTFHQSEAVLAAIEVAAIERAEGIAAGTIEDEPEETNAIVETDEQRFLADLDKQTDVDNLLSVGKDLEAAMQAALYDQGVLELPVEGVVVVDGDTDEGTDEATDEQAAQSVPDTGAGIDLLMDIEDIDEDDEEEDDKDEDDKDEYDDEDEDAEDDDDANDDESVVDQHT